MQPQDLDFRGLIPDLPSLEEFPDMAGLTTVASSIFSLFMIFGGAAPYLPQYVDIYKSKNAEGFSTFVCLVLLIANTLRILFWFGKQFELPLLFQSIVINITMLVMLHLCTKVKLNTEIVSNKPKKFSGAEEECKFRIHRILDFDRHSFWKWTDFQSYLQFIGLFTLVTGFLTCLFMKSILYVEILGFAALFIEALLGTPQFYRNLRNKSTKGMSLSMVLLWLVGDVMKTVYFVINMAPAQFSVCGFLQISIDIAILLQVWYYSSKTALQ